MVRDPQRDEVGSSGGGARLEGDGDGEPRDHAAEDDEHDLVAQERREVEDVEEQRGEGDLGHREDDEAPADAAPAHECHGDVQREHTERGVDMDAAERGDAVEEDRDAGEAAGQEVGGLNEGLDEEGLDQGGHRDGRRGDDAADDGEARELERAVGELVDGVRHGRSFCR